MCYIKPNDAVFCLDREALMGPEEYLNNIGIKNSSMSNLWGENASLEDIIMVYPQYHHFMYTQEIFG